MGDGWVRRDPKTGNYQKTSWLDELFESCGAQVLLIVLLLSFAAVGTTYAIVKAVAS